MGYRNYFFQIEKENYNLVKDMTVEELKVFFKKNNAQKYNNYEEEGGVYLSIIELIPMKQIFEFGKYYENKDNIIELGTPMFEKTETQKYFYEYKPFIVGKDAIKSAIDFYKNEIVDYYKELNIFLEDLKDENNQEEIRRIIANRVRNWTTVEKMVSRGMDKEKADEIFLPYNLNLKEEAIVNSDLFEYMIFELVRLYKTIDLENNVLMFCGH